MARSTYIYVVVAPGSNDLKAAFTVKYECASWAARHDPQGELVYYRVRDGKTAEPTAFDPRSA